MDSIFGVPWDQLSLDELRAFLRDAEDEGITWEAKAADPRRDDAALEARLVRASACGFANAVGGFILLGVARDPDVGEWATPGVAIPHAEPKTWLDDVIGALRPRPKHDAHVWETGVGVTQQVGVVHVEPVAEPPCMTPGGEIYERVSGKTVRVIEPLALAQLYRRGENARRAAEELSAARLCEIIISPPMREQERLRVCLSIRATAYEDDIARRLFSPATVDEFTATVRTNLKPDRYSEQGPVLLDNRQDALIAETLSGRSVDDVRLGGDRVWRVWATWDGVVAIRCAANDAAIGIDIVVDDILRPAWRVAAHLVPLLGGYGNAHLVVELAGDADLGPRRVDWLPRQIGSSKIMQRRLAGLDPDNAALESLQRELMRAVGYRVWEPEPGTDPGTTWPTTETLDT